MMESICSVLALVLILVACVELCGAATVVDVYRLIQYDLAGAPFGSRAAGLSHHAGAPPFAPGADLSRTFAMIPVRELNLTFLQGLIGTWLLSNFVYLTEVDGVIVFWIEEVRI